MRWQWWFGRLALKVKCQQLLPSRESHVYFLNPVEGPKPTRNWKIFESDIRNDQLIMQCLEYKSSRLVLQAQGRQYHYWGRRPDSGIVVCGDDSLHIKKNRLPLPLDYHKHVLSGRVRLLLARARTEFCTKQHKFLTLRASAAGAPLNHRFRVERFFFQRICNLGERVRHIFVNIMHYFNPLQNLTFIWKHPRATPSFRSGGLCTSIIRRSVKRNAGHVTRISSSGTGGGRLKRARLRRRKQLQENKSRNSMLNVNSMYVHLNKKTSKNRNPQQDQENKMIDLVMSRVRTLKTNIFWEFLCRSVNQSMVSLS